MELAGDVGRGRGVVEKDRATAHAGEGAVGSEHDRAQMVVVADAAEHDLLARRRFLGRLGGPALVLLGPRLGLGEGPVVDRHIVALGGEVPRHRKAHHTQTQKRHLGHRSLPRKFPCELGAAAIIEPNQADASRRGLPAGRASRIGRGSKR